MPKGHIKSNNNSPDTQTKEISCINIQDNQHKKMFKTSKQKSIKLNDIKKKEDKPLIYSYNNYMPKIGVINNNVEIKELDHSINLNIKDEIKDLKQNFIISKNKKRGRKTKNDNSIRAHNKYANDNLRRKCKYILINNILNFINEQIKEIYNGNIGNGISKKELLPVNKKSKYETGIKFNKKLLNKTIGEILSDNISHKFTYYLPNHNRIIIKTLLNDKDEYKKNCFQKLFNITFLQCLKQFIGIESIEELDGLKTFYEIKDIEKEDPEYINALKYYFFKFEENIKKKCGKNKSTTKE